MNWQRILGWAVVIFSGYYILKDPQGASHAVKQLLSMAQQAGNSIATFLNNV